jgi:hypothetical protein
MLDSLPPVIRCSVVICINEDFVCSGVFAKSFGILGIITAKHCADEFLAVERFVLSVAEDAHYLSVASRNCQYIPVGDPDTDNSEICFVAIRDKDVVLAIMQQNYYFYDLDDVKYANIFNTMPAAFNWTVAGNPEEKISVRQVEMHGQSHKVITALAANIGCLLRGYDIQGRFDFVKLMIVSGVEDYPKSYRGVSGGGIWYHRFILNDDNTYTVEPFLAGIVCWQAEAKDIRGINGRILTGHGWVAVYGHLRKALYDTRVAFNKQIRDPSKLS